MQAVLNIMLAADKRKQALSKGKEEAWCLHEKSPDDTPDPDEILHADPNWGPNERNVRRASRNPQNTDFGYRPS